MSQEYQSIHARGTWPSHESYPPIHPGIEAQGKAIIAYLKCIRKDKTSRKLPMNAAMSKVCLKGIELDESMLRDLASTINIDPANIAYIGPSDNDIAYGFEYLIP